MKKLSFLLLYLLLSGQLYAQFYLQPEFGQVINYPIGTNTIGPVVVSPNNGGSPPVTSFSLDIGYQLDSQPFTISMRSRYFTGRYGFLLINTEEDNGVFGPTMKGFTLGVATLNVQPTFRIKAIELGKWAFSVLGGPSLLFQIPTSDDFGIDPNRRFPITAGVIRQIDDSVKPLIMGITFGGILSYRRFSFAVDYHTNMNSSFTDDLMFNGEQYRFSNTARYLSFALGYSIIDKRRIKD